MSDKRQLSIEQHLWKGPEHELTIRDIIVNRKNLVAVAAEAAEYALNNMSNVSDRIGNIAKDHDYLLAGSVEDVRKPDAEHDVIDSEQNQVTSRSDMTLDARDKVARIHQQMSPNSTKAINQRADAVKPGDFTKFIDREAA